MIWPGGADLALRPRYCFGERRYRLGRRAVTPLLVRRVTAPDEMRAFGAAAGHHRLHAVRAHLLEMAGEVDAALTEYETAASRTTSVPESHYLTMRAAQLNERRSTRGG